MAYAAPGRGAGFRGFIDNRGAARKVRYVSRFARSGALLDIGCATGRFIGMARKRGFDVSGVENNARAAETARNQGLDVFCGDVADAGFERNRFDVVTMWHVLEHVRDPRGTVSEVARILRPGGWFVFCVPNTASLNARLLGKLWSGFDVPRHLFAFTDGAVAQLLEGAGLEIKDRRTFFGSFSAFNFDLKFWLEEKFGTGVFSTAVGAVARSFFFRLLASPLMFLIERAGRGPVVTYAVRKPDVSGKN
jgi:SAM-dependent methyltransferase